jgi:hypothetical protein
MAKFTDAIGFSKLDTYRTCPQKFAYQFIEKLPQPGSPAMDRGGKIHGGIEAYMNGWQPELPPEAQAWKEAFDALKGMDFKGEESWGFDKNWNKLPNWFGKDCWLRAKSDGHYVDKGVLTVLDWKTGKYRVPSTEQLELYAICGGAVYPEVLETKVEMWFIDTDQVYDKTYTREQLLALRKVYEGYFAPIYQDETWTPTPSQECRWCPYSKTKGGKCKY